MTFRCGVVGTNGTDGQTDRRAASFPDTPRPSYEGRMYEK